MFLFSYNLKLFTLCSQRNSQKRFLPVSKKKKKFFSLSRYTPSQVRIFHLWRLGKIIFFFSLDTNLFIISRASLKLSKHRHQRIECYFKIVVHFYHKGAKLPYHNNLNGFIRTSRQQQTNRQQRLHTTVQLLLPRTSYIPY